MDAKLKDLIKIDTTTPEGINAIKSMSKIQALQLERIKWDTLKDYGVNLRTLKESKPQVFKPFMKQNILCRKYPCNKCPLNESMHGITYICNLHRKGITIYDMWIEAKSILNKRKLAGIILQAIDSKLKELLDED